MRKVALSEKYVTRWNESNALNEAKDCGVMALSLVFDLPYEYAHEALAACGRKNRKGTHIFQLHQAIELVGGSLGRHEFYWKVGYGMDHLDGNEFDRGNNKFTIYRKKGLTPNNIIDYVDPNKRYIAYTKRHVFAIVDGKVLDHFAGRKFRIEELVEVTGY